ncbi:MAG: cysteine synthase A [Chloroflexi bacterium]|nr:cysteine synthase A [Chloroflexota bacterium]
MPDWSSRRKIAGSILETAGLTPLVELRRVVAGAGARICGKLEFFNPSQSVKDRILPFMVGQAERRGDLKPGMSIIEASTGSTGIATAMVGAAKGYPVVIVMPEGMSEERKKSVLAYGAELILTPGGESDVDLTLAKVAELKAHQPGRFWEAGQFTNWDNVEAHYRTTGPELWEQTGGEIDIFVAAQGTGGTLTGVARYLREQKPSVRIFAVEPEECPILSGGSWGPHQIEGIGDGFIPEILDETLLDGVVTVSSEDSIAMARRLAQEEGILCGISSGCNVQAARKLARSYPEARMICTMIVDTGLRYFSTPLFGEETAAEVPEREHPIRESDRQRLARRQLIIVR